MPPLGTIRLLALTASCLTVADCGNAADRAGVAAQCASTSDCGTGLVCLTFKGGYCGILGCTADASCPDGAACVTHTDGKNYCFRVCADKSECNANRAADVESNCVSNTTFVEGAKGRKACVPPSGT